MFKRLHLIANNTRFLVLGERGVLANLASCMMSAMLRRLSDDWQEQYGRNYSGIAADWGGDPVLPRKPRKIRICTGLQFAELVRYDP